MSDVARTFFIKSIVDPIRSNLASVLFWFGTFLVFVGAIFGQAIDALTYAPNGTSEFVLKVGSAILGAGVFAVIMKSGQFTELFQKHIYDVFYDPTLVKEKGPLIEKWRTITSALLQNVLPTTHREAVDYIEDQFFNSELAYHFDDHSIFYDVTIDKTTNTATVIHTTRTTLVLSPKEDNPILEQSIITDGEVKLVKLLLNGKEQQIDAFYTTDPVNPKKRWLKLPLKEYATTRVVSNDRVVSFERVISFSQGLSEEPYMKGSISRYVKGATVNLRVTPGCKVFFEKFGLGDMAESSHIQDDGNGYERWVLAYRDELLLPGQGFIIFLHT